MQTDRLLTHQSYLLAKPILDRFENDLRAVPTQAWDRWQALPPDAKRVIGSLDGGLATVVAAYMKEAAAERFDSRRDEGIIPRDRYDPPGWSFHNRVLVRFKKMDEHGVSRNYPTKRARRYLLNLPIEEEQLYEQVRIEVGYCLNEQETEISQIWVVHRRGGGVRWRYGLKDDGALVLPLAPRTSEEADDHGSFVKPRPPSREGAVAAEDRSSFLRVWSADDEKRETVRDASEAEHGVESA